jgi:hypothetical protein
VTAGYSVPVYGVIQPSQNLLVLFLENWKLAGVLD